MTLRPKRNLVPHLRLLAADLLMTAGEYHDLLKSVPFADGGDLLHQANELVRERKEELLEARDFGRLSEVEVVRKQSEDSGEGERERKLIIEDLHARMLPDVPQGYSPEFYSTAFTRANASILLQNASHPLVIREFARHPVLPAVGLCRAPPSGTQYARAVSLLNALLSLIAQGTLVARPAPRPPPQEARIPALPLTRWVTFRSSYVPDQSLGEVEPLAAGTFYLPPEIMDEVERFVGPSTMTLSRRSRNRVRREDRAVAKKLVALSGRLGACLLSPTAATIRFLMRTPRRNSYYWGTVSPKERAAAIRRKRRQCCATSVSTGERCLRVFSGTLAGREPLCHSHTAQPRPVLAAPTFRCARSLAIRSSPRLRRLVSESRRLGRDLTILREPF